MATGKSGSIVGAGGGERSGTRGESLGRRWKV